MSETAHARRTDPGTSHLAAAAVDVPKQRARVYAILLDLGDLTDEEIANEHERRTVVYGWPRASASGLRSRRHELHRDGWVLPVIDPAARTALGHLTLRWHALTEPVEEAVE